MSSKHNFAPRKNMNRSNEIPHEMQRTCTVYGLFTV